MAAQMSNVDAVPVQVVTGKEWEAIFLKRFSDERNISAGRCSQRRPVRSTDHCAEEQTMNILQDHWRKGEVPIANGFAFPDSSFVPVDYVETDDFPATFPIRTDLQSALDEKTRWTGFHVLAEAIHEASGLGVIAGECGMGGDGFVALIEPSSKDLKWVLFFDYSNPFEKTGFEGQSIVAINNIYQAWIIPINALDGDGVKVVSTRITP